MRGALTRAGAGCDSVLDLGCFDGRSLEFLPERPRLYLGLDANWEHGLDAAKARFRADARCEFHECRTPTELRALVARRKFDTAISLETLEHVSELLAATLGRMDRVERCEHKGFDYETVVEAIGAYFDVVEVSGYPFRNLPRSAGFGVGILARARCAE